MNQTSLERTLLWHGSRIRWMVAFALLCCACGCSSAHRSPPPAASLHALPPAFQALDGAFWWKCRFKIVWPKEGDADLALDLLLAHAVVSPVLESHAGDLPYWRFHRRAVRDRTGHQFTFLFYGRPETAAEVFAEIGRSRVLRQAMAANLVEKTILDDPDHPRLPGIEATSDPRWSPELRRNWPPFIMGVSALWLGLISDAMDGTPEIPDDPHLLLAAYRKVDSGITGVWRNEGQHALLHHLNAVFGYEETLIRKALSF